MDEDNNLNATYFNLVNSISEAVVTTDANYHITGWNNSAEKIYGWRADEVIGQKREDVLGTLLPNGSRWDENLMLAAGDLWWEGEVFQRKRDRTRLTVHSAVTADRDREGKITGLTFLNRDLTPEKTLAEKLMLSEAEFKALTQAVPELVWLADEHGQTYWYNQRWYHYTGTTLGEMAGNGWQKVHNPDYLPRLMKRIGQAFKRGEPWEDVFPLRGKDGKFRIFHTRAIPIRDPKGVIIRWLGTNTDISELREARDAKKECEESYQRLLVNLQEGFALFETAADATGKAQDLRFAEVNGAFESMTGMTQNRVVGNSLYALYPSDANLFFEYVRQAESTGKPQQFEWVCPVSSRRLNVLAYIPKTGYAAVLLRPV